MKNLMTRWLALGLALTTLIVIIQGPSQVTEAKKIKIKKVLKELKKLKKYGYLLAYQRKKLYAIPFPMPLPIFVKRQHIYTTIPIIPRYIQHPQHSSSHGTSSYSSMASSSSETSAAASPPPSYETSGMNMYMPESSSSASYQSSPSKSSSYSSILSGSYGMPTRTKSKKYSLLDQSSYMNAIPSSSKYLTQLASALGQSSLGGTTTNKDLLSKIMNGQAKILAPTSLLSAIKGPSSALLNFYQQQTGSSSSSSSPSSASSSSSSSASSSSHDDQDTKTGEHSSSSSSDETTGSSAVTKAQDSSSSSGEANKPSASEIHKSRFKPYMIRTPYGRIPPAAANMIASMNPAAVMGPGMMPPPPHPFAMMAAQSPALMQRIPMLQPASAQLMGAGDYMPAVVYPVTGQLAASASDQLESQSSDINENYAAPNDSQQRDDELARYRAGLMLQQRRQALLRLALMRERERELVEPRGQQQPTTAQQIRVAQMLAYYKQQQQLRHLQQMHQLQQLHHHRHHQQQLQQNSIDR